MLQWTKPGYITMPRIQSNNQWSGGIAAVLPQKIPSAKIRWKIFRLDFFPDQDVTLLIDYLPQGQTINAAYYLSLPVQLKNIFKVQRRGKITKGFLIMHENASAHRAVATQKKLAYLGFQFHNQPHYSADLAPSEYHLLPGLKNNEIIAFFHPKSKSLL